MNDGVIKQIRVTKIIKETEHAKTFVLEPIDWQPSYQSGQFLTLVFYTPFGEKRRSYSLSSAPSYDDSLMITVKKVDNGEFSRWMISHVKEGTILHTSGISGFFTLPELTKEKTFCFIAAGSGITPCFSLIKTLLLTTNEKLFLFYSNHSEEETIFFSQLKKLEDKYPDRFTIYWLFSNRMNVYESRMSDWLLTHLMSQYFSHADKSKLLFYLCGPFSYRLMLGISLISNGIQKEQFFQEDFNPLPHTHFVAPPDTDKHLVTILIGNKKHILEVQYPHSITATAKAHKIAVPYSCEAGSCGSCVAQCLSGKIWMTYNEVLTEKDIAEGKVLTCQAFPIDGDVEIRY